MNECEQRLLCSFIRPWIVVAQAPNHPYREEAKNQITDLLWRWTADGVDLHTGIIKRGAIKYDPKLVRVTESALRWINQNPRSRRGENLTHEHAVPRRLLAERMIAKNMDEDAILALLTQFCHAVIVTREEDRLIKPRCKMPNEWSWEHGDLLARYPARICRQIIMPAYTVGRS